MCSLHPLSMCKPCLPPYLPYLPDLILAVVSEAIGSARSINPSRLKRFVSTNAISEIRVWLLIGERGVYEHSESSVCREVGTIG